MSARRVSIGWLVALVLSAFASSPSLSLAAPDAAPPARAAMEERAATSMGASREANDGDRAARLERALDEYARALSESDRDARLAGFARAERGFAALAADGVETAALYTNLGNAALQAQHPGRAVLAYQRALRIDPDAITARQNLAHVRSGWPAWVPRREAAEGAQSLLGYREIAPETRGLVAAICFAAMSASIALAVRRREGAWRGLAILLGIAWVAGLGSLVYDARAAGESALAVVVSDEALARSADSSLAPLALPEPLPPGVEVEALEERNGWARVRLANGRDVWLRASSIERVVPSTPSRDGAARLDGAG